MFSQCCSLFSKGRLDECLVLLRNMHFPKFELDEWTKENNILVCEVTKLCQTRGVTPGSSEFSKLQTSMEKLLLKIQGVPVSQQMLPAELTVAHNVCCMRLLTHNHQHRVDKGIPVEKTASKTLARVLQIRRQRRGLITASESEAVATSESMLHTMLNSLATLQLNDDVLGPLQLLLCTLAVHKLLTEDTATAWDVIEAASLMLKQKDNAESHHTPTNTALSLLGGQLTEPGPQQFVDFLSAVTRYATGDMDNCISLLKNIKSEPLVAHARFLEAHSLLKASQHSQCTAVLQDQLDNMEQLDSHQVAQLYTVAGNCLAAQGKPHSALQSYKEALKTDIGCLVALFNVSLQYGVLGLHNAELEALNLLATTLTTGNTSVEAEDSSVLDIPKLCLQTVIKEKISPEHAVYALAKRCLELGRFEVAAQKYETVINLIQDNTRLSADHLSPYPFHLPGLRVLQLEYAFSLVRHLKYQDAADLCDRLMECCGGHTCEQQGTDFQELGTFNLSLDADLESSQKPSLTINTPAPSELGVSCDHITCGTKQTDQKLKSCERKETGHRKRLRSEEPDAAEKNTTSLPLICIAAHLYKAEGLVGADRHEQALGCVDCCLKLLKPLLSEDDGVEEVTPKQKRQRLHTEVSDAKAGRDSKTSLAVYVYSLKSQLLLMMDQLPAALHWSRLALQLCPGDTAYQYNHCKLLERLGRHRESCRDWLNHRGVDPHMDVYQIQCQLRQKNTQLREAERQQGQEDSVRDLADVQLTELDFLHMDTESLETLQAFLK